MLITAFLARIAVGILFVVAGWSKLRVDKSLFLRTVLAYELLPSFLSSIVASILPPMEITIGLMLLVGLLTQTLAFLGFVRKGILFMSIKWSRRRLLAIAGTLGAFASVAFPELSLKAEAATTVKPRMAWSELQLTDEHEITGAELASLRAKISTSPDVTLCAGSLNVNEAEFKAVRHKVVNSTNTLLAVAWYFPSSHHVLAYKDG